MNSMKTKLVKCNKVVYTFDYSHSKNVSQFLFENESIQLQRLILTNFVEDYVVTYFTIELPLNIDTDIIKDHLKTFQHQKSVKYIAVLEKAIHDSKSYLHILINKTADFLPALWQDTLTIDALPYDELLNFYSKIYLDNGTLFSSNETLKKPRVMHNEKADDYINEYDLLDCIDYSTHEIFDDTYGNIIVNVYADL